MGVETLMADPNLRPGQLTVIIARVAHTRRSLKLHDLAAIPGDVKPLGFWVSVHSTG